MYQTGHKVHRVLSDITYVFDQNESYAITGVSGSGKSTLLALLGGIDEPSTGSVWCDNQNLSYLGVEKKESFLHATIGLVFQFHYLIQELSILENVMIRGLIQGKTVAECTKDARRLLDYMGLSHKEHAYPRELTGGEQQRASIARAVYNKPRIQLADEPTGRLDAENAERG